MSSSSGPDPTAVEEGLAEGPLQRRRGRSLGDVFTATRMLSGALRPHRVRISAFLVYMVAVLCLIYLVSAGAVDWAVGWGILGCLALTSSVWFAWVIHNFSVRRNASRRRRQRIPRGALEATLQIHHPGIDLGRLRLLLVDRDFTGEDYQALLDLDENNEVPSTVGASEGEIRRNPSFLVREPASDSVAKPKNCSICLYPFKPRERVRIIPCLHQFHTECIDPWLRQNAICPVCKFPAVG